MAFHAGSLFLHFKGVTSSHLASPSRWSYSFILVMRRLLLYGRMCRGTDKERWQAPMLCAALGDISEYTSSDRPGIFS